MASSPRVIFVANSLRVGGSQSVLLQLVDIAVAQGWETIVASKGGSLAEAFEARGARCVSLLMREGTAEPRRALLSPSKAAKAALSVLAAKRLAALATGAVPVLIHASQPWPVGIAAMAAGDAHVPLIWHVHGTTPVETPPQFLRLVTSKLTTAIAVTPEVAAAVTPIVGADRVSILPNPVHVVAPSALPSSDGRTHIGTVCTLTANKRAGVSATMRAARAVAIGGPVCLHIVGDGPERARLELEARDLERTTALEVVFHGEQADAWPCLAQCRVIVGVGLVAVEACFRGHRVVVAGNDGFGGALTAHNADELWQTNYTGRGVAGLNDAVLAGALALADTQEDTELARVREALLARHGSVARDGFVNLWTQTMSGGGS